VKPTLRGLLAPIVSRKRITKVPARYGNEERKREDRYVWDKVERRKQRTTETSP
jgi:hypothetical protein